MSTEGAGYDAAVASRIGAARQGSFGRRVYRRSASALYAWEGLREMLSPSTPRFSLTVDGVEVESRAAAAQGGRPPRRHREMGGYVAFGRAGSVVADEARRAEGSVRV